MARPATTLPHPLVAGATCVDLSVLVPVYNEQETLPELERRLGGVLDGLGLDCEVIAVNDGSADGTLARSEEHTSELQSRLHLVCRLLLEKKKKTEKQT